MTAPTMAAPSARCPTVLRQARLPQWLLGPAWPTQPGGSDTPALARITLHQGRVHQVVPEAGGPLEPGGWDLAGALVLPAFVDAHVHLDKTFTRERAGRVSPGLLGAIEASTADLVHWTPNDIRTRATRALEWAWEAGTMHVRSHVNWPEVGPLPMAWSVLTQLAHDWADRLVMERVSLTKLDSFVTPAAAQLVAQQVKAGGPGTVLGGFVHSTNWHPQALRNLLEAAQSADLDVDLHVDEELTPGAQGLLGTAQVLRDIGFQRRVVCGHVCALAAMPRDRALAILDQVALAPITLVSLPITNLLLQDATTGETPRWRGITLVKEAHARGIPLLFASDNVEDPFCAVGSYDPIDAMASAVTAAQLESPFDNWSDTICRSDWLAQQPHSAPTLVDAPANLVIFTQANASGWPSRSGPRVVMRTGVAHHAPPPAWFAPSQTPPN
jgi:cytosine/creatinine deaminase